LWGAPALLLLLGAGICWRIVAARSRLVAEDHEPLEEDVRS
jgi:cytochrome c-type biogenesis protein CcmH/NrfF